MLDCAATIETPHAPRARFVLTDGRVATSLATNGAEFAQTCGEFSLERALGVRGSDLSERLHNAVQTAITDRRSSVLLWREANETSPGRLLTITPSDGGRRALIEVDDLDTAPSLPPANLLTELFGVSPAEADIALGLMNDERVSQIACRRAVTAETVRGQIKSLLRKMGLNSQKQLISVLARVAGACA